MKRFFSGILRSAENTDIGEVSREVAKDGFNQSLAEVSDFDVLLLSMDSYGRQLLDIMPSLRTAPSALLKSLDTFYSKDSAGGELVAHFSTQMNACGLRVTCGMPHLQKMMQLIEQARSQIASIKEAAEMRQKAWSSKLKCDQEIKRMMRRRKLSHEAKSTRMKARSDAEEEYTRISNELQRLINEVLYNRGANIAAALTELGHCYSKIFESSPELAGDLIKSTQDLASMSELNRTENNEVRKKGLLSLTSSCQKVLSANSCFEEKIAQASTKSTLDDKMNYPLLESFGSSVQQYIPFSKQPPLPPPLRPPSLESIQTDMKVQNETNSAATACPQLKYFTGEKINVWSESQHTWLVGTVQEVFPSGGTYENYSVPAGVIKVESTAGVKFIPPEQIGKMMRKVTSTSSNKEGTPAFPGSNGKI